MKDKGRVGFRYAIAGIRHVLRTERNFRIHLILFLLAILLGVVLRISEVQWLFVIGVSGLVLVAEMVNTAIEVLVDYIKPEIHTQAKAVKDIAAGAVLIAALTAFLTGVIIFMPRIIQWLY